MERGGEIPAPEFYCMCSLDVVRKNAFRDWTDASKLCFHVGKPARKMQVVSNIQEDVLCE